MDIEEIKQAISELEQESKVKLLGDVLNETRLFTQDEIDSKIIPRALAPKLKQIESLTSQVTSFQAELDNATKSLRDLQQTKDTVKTDKDQQLQTIKEQHAHQTTELKKLIQEYKSQLTEVQNARTDDFFAASLQATLLDAGANPKKISQAALIARQELPQLKVEQNNGHLEFVAVDPTLGDRIEPNSVVSGWLKANQHFARPQVSGAGTQTARPTDTAQPKKEPFEGVPVGSRQINTAMQLGHGLRKEPYTDKQ